MHTKVCKHFRMVVHGRILRREPRYRPSRAAPRRALSAIAKEITQYPTPIAGCDVQFNHLLADRARLSRALGALEAEVFVPTPRTLFAGAGIESR